MGCGNTLHLECEELLSHMASMDSGREKNEDNNRTAINTSVLALPVESWQQWESVSLEL